MIRLLLIYIPSILCALHVVKRAKPSYWLFLLVIAPIIAPTIYFIAIWLADIRGGAPILPFLPQQGARRAPAETEDGLVGARTRLALAALENGKPQEAEPLFRDAMQGRYARDPAILLGHARALVELGRFEEALESLERLSGAGAAPSVTSALTYARTYEGLNRAEEADAPYRYAFDQGKSIEAAGRYSAFLAKAGRIDEAKTILAEIDRRVLKAADYYKPEARHWRKFAADALNDAAPQT